MFCGSSLTLLSQFSPARGWQQHSEVPFPCCDPSAGVVPCASCSLPGAEPSVQDLTLALCRSLRWSCCAPRNSLHSWVKQESKAQGVRLACGGQKRDKRTPAWFSTTTATGTASNTGGKTEGNAHGGTGLFEPATPSPEHGQPARERTIPANPITAGYLLRTRSRRYKKRKYETK